jgi:two-component system, OmpR family, sensor kinase
VADGNGVKLLAEAPPSPAPRVALGAGHLEQILDNLLDNAIEVTPHGKRIEVSVRPSEGWVEVHVVDEGPGMPDEDRRRAFDRFWRGASEGASGSGLGLAIVEQLVRGSGGRVELLESDSGGIDAVVKLQPATGDNGRS